MKFVCDACKSDGMGACVIEVNFNDGLDNCPWKCPYDDTGETECNWHKVPETPQKHLRIDDKVTDDAVDHPSHYGGADNPYETIKVADALGWGLIGAKFNALKYLMRAGDKNGEPELRDMRKCLWYVQHAIEILEARE